MLADFIASKEFFGGFLYWVNAYGLVAFHHLHCNSSRYLEGIYFQISEPRSVPEPGKLLGSIISM